MPRTKGKAAQRAFLAAYANCASITKAAKAAGLDRRAHYDWLEHDPDYPAKFDAATEQAAQALEDEATRRAYDGVLQAEFYQGKAVGTKRVYSDGLMMFLLRGMKPKKYRTNSIELSGPDGAPIEMSIVGRLNAARDRLAALKNAKTG